MPPTDHKPWKKYLHFAADGCLVITDESLAEAIKSKWEVPGVTDFCVKYDYKPKDGGGGGKSNALCTCRRVPK